MGGILWFAESSGAWAIRISIRGRSATAVKDAKRAGDPGAENEAHRMVDETKRALGERGPVWWKDGAPDFNGHAVTPYADWYAHTKRAG
jgi:hypothetical protein